MEPSRDERACFKGGSENILFCLKGHRKSQLGSLAEPARSRPNGLSCLAGHFYGLQSRISNKAYSEPLKHALSPCEGRLNFFQFHLKSTLCYTAEYYFSWMCFSLGIRVLHRKLGWSSCVWFSFWIQTCHLSDFINFVCIFLSFFA